MIGCQRRGRGKMVLAVVTLRRVRILIVEEEKKLGGYVPRTPISAAVDLRRLHPPTSGIFQQPSSSRCTLEDQKGIFFPKFCSTKSFGTSHRDALSHASTKNLKRGQVITRVGAVT
jgi:hypothetical protein